MPPLNETLSDARANTFTKADGKILIGIALNMHIHVHCNFTSICSCCAGPTDTRW